MSDTRRCFGFLLGRGHLGIDRDEHSDALAAAGIVTAEPAEPTGEIEKDALDDVLNDKIPFS